MANFKETSLWVAAFENAEARAHQDAVKALEGVFDKARENAKVLVSEIAIDLPGYTVHDITHLDALWEVGSQITGTSFTLNPIEGFVLGCSFLFHDAAMTMAAYPGGLKEIEDTKEWKRISGRMNAAQEHTVDVEQIIEVFLREQHAIRAHKLPKIAWDGDSGSRYLIDDADSRDRFGDFIGQVATSHWWNHSELEDKLNDKVIPAPAPFPSSWSVDLLKLASVLRTADASQIDERRAPGLLRALRSNRLSNYSAKHWTFQNKLTQAQNRGDTLFFAAFRPFPKEEANEWWMLHDILKMIDGELRKTDDLLSRSRGNEARFAARRVANIEAPESLQTCIPTIGWQPVDTAFSITDIPRLVENLGGDQLYGHDNMAALREVIQNAMDAVRLRQLVDPNAPEPMVEVKIGTAEGTPVITIRDNGIGMSESSIVENLLSFGTSGWLGDTAIGEYNDEFPSKASVSGRYGIGFFSIFMLGNEINVKSRRFDASPDQTTILSFPDGLKSRPLLCGAEFTERMTIGGTEIQIKLVRSKLEAGSRPSRFPSGFWSDDKEGHKALVDAVSTHFPTSSVPIHIKYSEGTNLIDGRNWETEPAAEFLKRIEGSSYPVNTETLYEEAVSLIREADGTIMGRGVLNPSSRNYSASSNSVKGVVVTQGARVCDMLIRGVLLGEPIRAARDYAIPFASHDAMRQWATQQGRALKDLVTDVEDQERIAEQIAVLGGEIGDLKFCEVGGNFLSADELRAFLRDRHEIWVAFNAGVSNVRPRNIASERTDTCISVSCGTRSIIYGPMEVSLAWPSREYSKELQHFAEMVICEEFGISDEILKKITLIKDGQQVYSTDVAAWISSSGKTAFTTGDYYKRHMTIDDVDKFLVPESKRDSF